MSRDSHEMVKHYNKCHRFDKVMTNPPEELSSVLAPWPFAQWGVDLVGPLPIGKRGCRFILVAINYTKWVEVEALATVIAENIRNFLWKVVVC
jgi:hypothetical protein